MTKTAAKMTAKDTNEEREKQTNYNPKLDMTRLNLRHTRVTYCVSGVHISLCEWGGSIAAYFLLHFEICKKFNFLFFATQQQQCAIEKNNNKQQHVCVFASVFFFLCMR